MQNKNEGDKLIPTNTARIKMEKPEYPVDPEDLNCLLSERTWSE